MSDKLREAFEREFSKPPFEWNFERFPEDERCSWPGKYRSYHVECAWEAFQAGHAHAIKFATGVIESHRVPIGNSSAGEMARDWTLDALKEVRDKINGARNE